jgi:hypothetical protein
VSRCPFFEIWTDSFGVQPSDERIDTLSILRGVSTSFERSKMIVPRNPMTSVTMAANWIKAALGERALDGLAIDSVAFYYAPNLLWQF